MADERERYRRLAEVLIQRNGPPGAVSVRLGELPMDWPAFASPPADARIVGAVVRRRGRELLQMSVYFDAGSVPVVLDLYGKAMAGAGWKPFAPREPRPNVAFRSAAPQPGFRMYVRSEEDPFFGLHAREHDGGAEVLVTWDAGLDHHPLRAMRPGAYGDGPLAHLMPDLPAPPDVPVQGGGGGGGPDEWHQLARAFTALPVLDLARHYDAELRRAGWALRDEGGDALVHVSRWRLPEGEHAGMLVVAARDDDQRDLLLVVWSRKRSVGSWRSFAAGTTP
ncbi:MAG TPA: hypothetical protein VFM93_01695 [Candidatus Limnocylindria bacterium]|nr:hypothetical protein [Candidatus Limnocylindria bacterium]